MPLVWERAKARSMCHWPVCFIGLLGPLFLLAIILWYPLPFLLWWCPPGSKRHHLREFPSLSLRTYISVSSFQCPLSEIHIDYWQIDWCLLLLLNVERDGIWGVANEMGWGKDFPTYEVGFWINSCRGCSKILVWNSVCKVCRLGKLLEWR